MISNVEVQQILDILVTVVDRFQVLQMFEVFKFNLLRRDKVSTDQLLMFYSDLSSRSANVLPFVHLSGSNLSSLELSIFTISF